MSRRRPNTNDDPPPPPAYYNVPVQQAAQPHVGQVQGFINAPPVTGQLSGNHERRSAAHGGIMGVVGVRVRSQPAALPPLQFIKLCATCNRKLGPHNDIYIFRGETAYCSNECRDIGMAAYAGN